MQKQEHVVCQLRQELDAPKVQQQSYNVHTPYASEEHAESSVSPQTDEAPISPRDVPTRASSQLQASSQLVNERSKTLTKSLTVLGDNLEVFEEKIVLQFLEQKV